MNVIKDMRQFDEYRRFIKGLHSSTPYFIASRGLAETQGHSVDLCIAYAFQAGMKAKVKDPEKLRKKVWEIE